nr:hypothetical protein [Rhodopirellula sp. SM50]
MEKKRKAEEKRQRRNERKSAVADLAPDATDVVDPNDSASS